MKAENLVEGCTYIIDKNFANGGPVILVKILSKHFCTVRDTETGGEWDTMIYRLTPIDEKHPIMNKFCECVYEYNDDHHGLLVWMCPKCESGFNLTTKLSVPLLIHAVISWCG